MNRYLIFKGWHNYPEGGWEDFFGDYDSLDEVEDRIKHFKNNKGISRPDWIQVVDTKHNEIIQLHNLSIL